MEKKVCELFAGVGGFRLGLERLNSGWETTWFSQWEPGAKTQWAHDCYVQHFGDCEDLRGELHTGEDISAMDKETLNRSTHVVTDPGTGRLRLLTPVEAERLQGFDDEWTNSGMPDRMRYF